MFAALKALFQAAQTLFMSADTLARSINNVCTWAEEESEGFNEKARLQRNQQLKQIRSQYSVEDVKAAHQLRSITQELGEPEATAKA